MEKFKINQEKTLPFRTGHDEENKQMMGICLKLMNMFGLVMNMKGRLC